MSDRTIVYTLAIVTLIGLTGYLCSVDNPAAGIGGIAAGFFMGLLVMEHLRR